MEEQESFDFESKIEKEIQDKGLLAPRITKDNIDHLMTQVKFIVIQPEDLLDTLVLAKLNNFTLAIGFSNCVSKANYNKEIGAKIASEDAAVKARDKLWELEGYHLSKMM